MSVRPLRTPHPRAHRLHRALSLALGLCLTAVAFCQEIVLDDFDAASPRGAVRAGTSWVGQVTPGSGAIHVGGAARDENGWGASGLNLDASGMAFLSVTAQRHADNAAPALVIQLEDRNLQTQTFSIRTASFGADALTAVQVPIVTWDAGFDPAHVVGWSIGGGGVGSVAFRMTLDRLALGATAAPGAPIAPVVTSAASSRTGAIGETVSFTVSATGTAPLAYQWFKDAAPVANNPTAATPTLMLAAVAASASGTYTCVVSNSAGTSTSPAQVLSVAATPATLTLGGLATTYSGAPQTATATTSPPGLAVTLTYNGNASAPVNAGSYTVVAKIDDPSYAGSTTGTLTIAKAPQRIAFAAPPAALAIGTPFVVGATASSGGAVTLSVIRGNATLEGTTLTPRDSGSITLRAVQAGDDNHTAASADLVFTTARRTQEIAFAPIADQPAGATTVSLSASASSGLPVSFSIVRGSAVLGRASLTLTGAGPVVVRASQAGNETFNAAPDVDRVFVVAAAPTPTVPVPPVGPPLDPPVGPPPPLEIASSRLINVSSRTRAGNDDKAAIAGFVITGDAPKQVLVRAIGPTLGQFGVAGAVAAPKLELFRGPTSLATNTGWMSGGSGAELAAAAQRVGAFALGANTADSALLMTLAPGNYTAVVTAADGRSGVGLIEVYDLSAGAAGQRISNLSVRAFSGGGAETLIVGVVVGGTAPQRVLIRAVGPTLAQFGVSDFLARPQLALFSGATELARNAGWSGSPEASALATAATRVGAFALAPGSADAALVLELAPGAYTAQVVSGDGATGVALVELYELR